METPKTSTPSSTERPRGRLMDQKDIDAFVSKLTLTKAKDQGKVCIDLSQKELNVLTCILQAFGLLHGFNEFLERTIDENHRTLNETIDKVHELTGRVDAYKKTIFQMSDNVASHELRVQFNNLRIEKLEQKIQTRESETKESAPAEPGFSNEDIKTYVSSAKEAVDNSQKALQTIEAERILTRDQLDRMRTERDAARAERNEMRREVQHLREETAIGSKCMNNMLNTLNKLRTTVEYMQRQMKEA